MNKEEISKMTKEEQIRQLEWSDQHEFSYWYAYYLLDYINQLETNISTAIDFIDIYTDGINLEAFDCLDLMYKIKDILKGSDK